MLKFQKIMLLSKKLSVYFSDLSKNDYSFGKSNIRPEGFTKISTLLVAYYR
jgi:hypothetical protein